jgi:hypothetical protein
VVCPRLEKYSGLDGGSTEGAAGEHSRGVQDLRVGIGTVPLRF